MSYVSTKLSPAEQAKVPRSNYVPLTWDELEEAMSLESGSRPRVYGYLEGEPHGCIVSIKSQYHVDKYRGELSFAWMSGTTIADLISRA